MESKVKIKKGTEPQRNDIDQWCLAAKYQKKPKNDNRKKLRSKEEKGLIAIDDIKPYQCITGREDQVACLMSIDIIKKDVHC